jgi:hypothetical protein
VLALSALIACGGQTKDEPAEPSDGPVKCPQGISIDQNFGNGPLDELVGAVRAIRGLDAATRSALFDEVGALGVVYGVHGTGDRLGMSELVPAIAGDIAKGTATGITAKLGPVGCAENIEATSSSEARCLEEGCHQCNASALCADVGRLNGLASATCDGPTFDASFVAARDLPADQQAALQNRVGQLAAHAPAILAAYARLSAILTGSALSTVIFDPSPAVEIRDEFETFASADAGSGPGIEPGCVSYAVPYLTAALAALGDETTDATSLLGEGDRFLGLFQR